MPTQEHDHHQDGLPSRAPLARKTVGHVFTDKVGIQLLRKMAAVGNGQSDVSVSTATRDTPLLF